MVRRQRSPSPEEEGETEETVRGAGAAASGNRKVDRFGNVLEVGDRLEFLTPGRCVGKIWTVYRLTEKRVLCERNKDVFKMHREYCNVKKL